MGLVLGLDDGNTLVVRWAGEGPLEGLDLQLSDSDNGTLGDDETDVSNISNWKQVLSRPIKTVGIGWFWPEVARQAVWSIRLSFEKGSSISIAMGRVWAEGLDYDPHCLLVIYDETRAREFRPMADWDPAYGVDFIPDESPGF